MADFEIVEPGKRLPAGVEEAVRRAIEALRRLIQTLAAREGELPALERCGLELDSGHLLHEPRFIAAENSAVIPTVTIGAQQVDGDLRGITHPIAAAHGGRAAPVALARIAREAGSGRRRAGDADGNAAGIEAAGAGVVPERAVAAGVAALCLPGIVAAAGQLEGELTGGSRCAVTREDLDDAADCVGAVQARARPAHDLDAVDLVDGKLLERRLTGRRRSDLDAIDENQQVIGVGAAHEHRGVLAEITGRCHGNSLQPRQQLEHRMRLQALDVGASDDGDGSSDGGQRLGYP